MTEKLFVYGTLCPGCPNEHILENIGGTWEPATIKGKLRNQGWGAELGYPGIDLDDNGEAIQGYIFSSSNLSQHWDELDEFEGDAYSRVLADVTLEDGNKVMAHLYTLRARGQGEGRQQGSVLQELQQLEFTLQQPNTRSNPDKLKQLLHPGFVEIGYSGTTWDFDSIIESLLSEPESKSQPWSQDFQLVAYTPGVAQLLYRSANLAADGTLSRFAKRSSIWVRDNGYWQVKFHQATPTTPFAKNG